MWQENGTGETGKKTFRKNTDVLWVDVFDFYTAVTTGE